MRKTAIILLLPLFLVVAVMCFYAVRYPLKYYDIVRDECVAFSVDAELVMAVIWTESKFNASAASSAGAVGLMQLKPETAEWCATMLGDKFNFETLFDPNTNVKYGVYYLSYIQNKFHDENLILAAYNAGEGNVSKWISSGTEIPFNETKNYVATVGRVKKLYKIKTRKTK